MGHWPANSRESVSEPIRPETLIFGADAAFGFAQMFWDSTTLTASSKLKESASPLTYCCPTTCLLRRPVEGFKDARAASTRNHDDVMCQICCCSWTQLKILDSYLHAGQCGVLNVAYTVSIETFYLIFPPSFVAKPLNCKRALYSLWNGTNLPVYAVHESVLPHRCS